MVIACRGFSGTGNKARGRQRACEHNKLARSIETYQLTGNLCIIFGFEFFKKIDTMCDILWRWAQLDGVWLAPGRCNAREAAPLFMHPDTPVS